VQGLDDEIGGYVTSPWLAPLRSAPRAVS
jgi:hypothetical protein